MPLTNFGCKNQPQIHPVFHTTESAQLSPIPAAPLNACGEGLINNGLTAILFWLIVIQQIHY